MIARITLPGDTPSLKNSKRIFRFGGNTRIVPSEAYQRWAGPLLMLLKSCELVGRDWRYPVRIDFCFCRKTRRHFDYINLGQGPLDLLVEAGVLKDDDMDHVVPGSWDWTIDKDNPRVELTIREASE